ncbi:hypothetical protein O1611_g7721 [Lasiodiplodia mahajangana]|uniref:Uncharacterized protein n=1 Tax=Lasiodiplodia mahajangana TaxID=1108764 RepID=A0ACC2JFB4_9PEZI|nr:hypothetical protein O1611_g7721 [Lasiodiplodia mahajangana]
MVPKTALETAPETAFKTVLVTGCSAGGIGGAIALALAKRGHRVIATARNTSKIADELQGHRNVTIQELDVSSTASVEAAQAATQHRRVDVIVNNAGGDYPMPILDIDINLAQQLHDTNVWGPIRMVKAFSDHLIASRGRVVNINSSAASLNAPWMGSYLSSKAALKSLSDVLRLELAPFGVTVVTIMAGVVSTSSYDDKHASAVPNNSRYSNIKENISVWATEETRPKGDSPEEFAELVMDDIIGDVEEAVVWRGSHANEMRELSQAPIIEIDDSMSKGKGLETLGGDADMGA